jgi:hypothetical protein
MSEEKTIQTPERQPKIPDGHVPAGREPLHEDRKGIEGVPFTPRRPTFRPTEPWNPKPDPSSPQGVK